MLPVDGAFVDRAADGGVGGELRHLIEQRDAQAAPPGDLPSSGDTAPGRDHGWQRRFAPAPLGPMRPTRSLVLDGEAHVFEEGPRAEGLGEPCALSRIPTLSARGLAGVFARRLAGIFAGRLARVFARPMKNEQRGRIGAIRAGRRRSAVAPTADRRGRPYAGRPPAERGVRRRRWRRWIMTDGRTPGAASSADVPAADASSRTWRLLRGSLRMCRLPVSFRAPRPERAGFSAWAGRRCASAGCRPVCGLGWAGACAPRSGGAGASPPAVAMQLVRRRWMRRSRRGLGAGGGSRGLLLVGGPAAPLPSGLWGLSGAIARGALRGALGGVGALDQRRGGRGDRSAAAAANSAAVRCPRSRTAASRGAIRMRPTSRRDASRQMSGRSQRRSALSRGAADVHPEDRPATARHLGARAGARSGRSAPEAVPHPPERLGPDRRAGPVPGAGIGTWASGSPDGNRASSRSQQPAQQRRQIELAVQAFQEIVRAAVVGLGLRGQLPQQPPRRPPRRWSAPRAPASRPA